MNKSIATALAIGSLLAGFGFFYHYVIFLPGIERKELEARMALEAQKVREEQKALEDKKARVEQEALEAQKVREEQASLEEQKAREEEKRQIWREAGYSVCKEQAVKNYEENWAKACTTQADIMERSLKTCLRDTLTLSSSYQYKGQEFCREQFGKADRRLPNDKADFITKHYENNLNRCSMELDGKS